MVFLNSKDWNLVLSTKLRETIVEDKENKNSKFRVKRLPDDENAFECDDLIAPVIQILNRKGYTTRSCCQGHIYNSYWSMFKNMYGFISEDSIILKIDRPYIGFKDTSFIPQPIPQGWVIDNNRPVIRLSKDHPIYKGYDGMNFTDTRFRFFRLLLEVHENLKDWANSLPVLKDKNSDMLEQENT